MPAGLVAASLLALVGLTAVTPLTACTGGDPDPAPTTLHPGTPATPTATPSGNPTDLAATAAIAAVQKLYADFHRMTESGSTPAYREDFTESCAACSANARLVESLALRHERIVGTGFVVDGLKVVLNQPNVVIVQGLLSHPTFTIRHGDMVKDTIAALPVTAFAWRVVPVGAKWLVAAADALK